MLVGAYHCCERASIPIQEFPLALDMLRKTGVTDDRLQALVDENHVELLMTTSVEEVSPGLRIVCPDCLPPSSCFVLTSQGASAIQRLLLAERTEGSGKVQTPRWVECDRELYFRGKLIKRYSRLAPSQQFLLDEFERLGWPARLKNPFDGDAGMPSQDCLENAVKGLNRRHLIASMRFVLSPDHHWVSWQAVKVEDAKSY